MTTMFKLLLTFAIQSLVILLIIQKLKETCNCNALSLSRKGKNFIVMTSLRCNMYDQNYAVVTKCILKAVNRTHKYVKASARALKTWSKPILIHFRVMKRANGGYKPFGIDVSLEGCAYLDGKKNPAVDWFFDLTFRYSNINHSCPFVEKEDVIFNIPVNQVQYPSVFPEGDYRFDFEFGSAGKMRIIVSAFVSLKEI